MQKPVDVSEDLHLSAEGNISSVQALCTNVTAALNSQQVDVGATACISNLCMIKFQNLLKQQILS